MTELSRRAFAESLAVAALAPVLGVPSGLVLRLSWTTPDEVAFAPPGALARALASAIREQYGSRLSAKDLATITEQIQSSLERVDRLEKVRLDNGDEPDFLFLSALRHGLGQ
jgi:hypothetical protein